MAQINDKQDKFGAALFFYRRYARLAGDTAREEASARLSALELVPGAKDQAQQFATSMHEPTAPVATPGSFSRHEVAAERTDGSLVPLKGPEELAQLAKTGALPNAPTVTPVRSGPTPYVIDPEALQRARASLAAKTPARDLVLSGDGDKVTVQSGGRPMQASSAAPSGAAIPATPQTASRVTRTTYASQTPAVAAGARDEDAELARAFSQGGRQRATPQVTPPPPQMTSSAPASMQGASASPPQTAAPSATPEIAYMSPTPAPEGDPRTSRFFTTKSVGGSVASLKLYNDIPDSVLTVKLVPEEEGDAINAIVAKDESRALKIPPARYTVAITITTSNYPPLALLDSHFPFEFKAGMQYLRRFNNDNVQEMK
jgi:hypothetical protein